MIAVTAGRPQIVRFLISYGADLDVPGKVNIGLRRNFPRSPTTTAKCCLRWLALGGRDPTAPRVHVRQQRGREGVAGGRRGPQRR